MGRRGQREIPEPRDSTGLTGLTVWTAQRDLRVPRDCLVFRVLSVRRVRRAPLVLWVLKELLGPRVTPAPPALRVLPVRRVPQVPLVLPVLKELLGPRVTRVPLALRVLPVQRVLLVLLVRLVPLVPRVPLAKTG